MCVYLGGGWVTCTGASLWALEGVHGHVPQCESCLRSVGMAHGFALCLGGVDCSMCVSPFTTLCVWPQLERVEMVEMVIFPSSW